MTSNKAVLLLIFGLFSTLSSADETFPTPPELQRDVDFWRDIFATVGSDEGVLHDNRNLGIVYERLPMPESLSRRERNRRVDKRRKQLQATLRTLAGGKRDQLSAEEARVLALWPVDVSNATLQNAVRQIRFQQGLRERFRAGLIRSGRWRAHVNQEFAALNLPIEIAALPHVESSYNPDARSHVGASGIWQFTRSTGRRFMRVDHVVDERNDPFAATQAAARLMAYNYSITGNWPMAITAYNHGLGGVRRAMRQFGDTAYVDILRKYRGRTFGFASRNFYVAFLAAKEIDQDVETYFPGLQVEAERKYDVLRLPQYVSLKEMTRALGVSASTLRQHNPALQATVWQGSKYLPKNYALRFPVGHKTSLVDAVAALPDGATYEQQLPDLYHTVVRGDTLSQVARTYKTRISTLSALNNLNSRHTIRIGQKLRLPAAGPAPVVVASAPPAVVATAAEIQEEPPIEESVADAAEAVAASTTTPVERVETELLSDPSDYSVAGDGTIEVHPLETLGHFGDWLEIKTQRLRDLNLLAFRTPVSVGQRIKLDLNTVDAKTFEERRVAYHRAQQDAYFQRRRINGVTTHTIRRGEAVWIIALRRYKVPVWLFRQYNPNVDMHNVRPGTTVQIPLLVDVESS